MKKMLVLMLPLIITGCIDVKTDCDSGVVEGAILSDFRNDLERKLPKGALDFIEGFELRDIKTLDSGNNDKSTSCEANVIVITTNNQEVFQSIKYNNYEVQKGEKDVHTEYVYIDTFSYLAKKTFHAIKVPYQTRIAHNAGFKSFSDFEKYQMAQKTVKSGTMNSERLKSEISNEREYLKSVAGSIDETKQALDEGKTVLPTNQFIEMDPVIIDKENSETTKFFRNEIEFTSKVRNVSNETFDSFNLNANIFINDENRAFETDQYSRVNLKTGLAPGEEREVSIFVSGSRGISSSIFNTSAWKSAKTVKIILRPSKYKNGRGEETKLYTMGRFNRSKVEITWDKYHSTVGKIKRAENKYEKLQIDLIKAKETISKIEKNTSA